MGAKPWRNPTRSKPEQWRTAGEDKPLEPLDAGLMRILRVERK